MSKKKLKYVRIKKTILYSDDTEFITIDEASMLSNRTVNEIKTWVRENRLPIYKQYKKTVDGKVQNVFIKRREYEAFLIHADRGLDLAGEIYESVEACAKDSGLHTTEINRLMNLGYLDPVPLPFKKRQGTVEAVGVSKIQLRNYLNRQEGYDVNTFGTVYKVTVDEDVVELFKERMGNSFPRRVSDWLHELVYDAICEGKHED